MNRAQGLVEGLPFLAGVVGAIVGVVAILTWLRIDTAAQTNMAQQVRGEEIDALCNGLFGCGPVPRSFLVVAVLATAFAIAAAAWRVRRERE